MKNLLNCRSLIKVAIITMLVALMASQMTATYAEKKTKKEKIHSILDEINNKLDQLVSGPAPVPVAKTGQTTLVEPGDDGDLEKGVTWPNPRFTDNEDGTVTDNLTGLIWLKDANCTDSVGGVVNFGALNWSDALTWCNNVASGSCGLTDGSTAGDWRLPNVKEFLSLIHYGVFVPPLPDTAGTGRWSDGDPFTNVKSDSYWSSTTNANLSAGEVWRMNFNIVGTLTSIDPSFELRVWCVRGP